MFSESSSRRTTIAFLLLMGATWACGHKKPPVPPPRMIPITTFGLRGHVRGNEAVLRFPYPVTNYRGAALDGVSKVEVYRSVQVLPPDAVELHDQQLAEREEAQALYEEELEAWRERHGIVTPTVPADGFGGPEDLEGSPEGTGDGFATADPASEEIDAPPAEGEAEGESEDGSAPAVSAEPLRPGPPPTTVGAGESSSDEAAEDTTDADAADTGAPEASVEAVDQDGDDERGAADREDAEDPAEDPVAADGEDAHDGPEAEDLPTCEEEREVCLETCDEGEEGEEGEEACVATCDDQAQECDEKVAACEEDRGECLEACEDDDEACVETCDERAEQCKDPMPQPLGAAPSILDIVFVDPRELERQGDIVLTLEGEALDDTVLGTEVILRLPLDVEPADLDAEEGSVLAYAFAIKTYSLKNLASNLSNPIKVVPRNQPAAPTALDLEPAPRGIELTWEVGEEPDTGFRVYRREADVRVYGNPVGTISDPEETEWTDWNAVLGTRYIYGVTAVSSIVPLVESGLEIEQEIFYLDTFPPAIPTNVVAFPEPGQIRVLWDVSEEEDVAGYIVYRRPVDGDAAALQEEPLAAGEYVDRDVRPGQRLLYAVVAVDESGNRSEASEEVQVRVP